MRLLVDCTPLSAGGGVQVASAFLSGLAAAPDVEWLAVLPEKIRPQIPGDLAAHRLRYVPKNSSVDLFRARMTLKAVERTFAPDIVFTVFGPAYFRAKAKHVMGFALPNLIYERDGPLARLNGPKTALADWVKRRQLQQADHLMVETETVKRRLVEALHYPAAQISVVGNAVNPLLFSHQRAPLPQSQPYRLLVPSAYYPHKNLEIIPRVAASLKTLAPSFRFEFALTLAPGSRAWQQIAQAALALDAAANIRTLGVLALDALAAAYRSSCAVFLPTLREASTAVYPESFYFERPLLTSDMDFARELCGEAACYFSPLDPEAVARAILSVAQDEALQASLIAKGKARLAAAYQSPEAKFEQQLALLKRISGS